MGTKSHHSQGASARIAAGTGRRSFVFFFFLCQSHSRAGPTPKTSWATQTGLDKGKKKSQSWAGSDGKVEGHHGNSWRREGEYVRKVL